MKQIFFFLALIVLASCASPSQETTTSEPAAPSALEQGQAFATQTQAVLGKNLMQALKTEGAPHAVDFCAIQAHPLTDSMAQALQATIRRVSDQHRNPNNRANDLELAYIEAAKAQLAAGEPPAPQLQEIAGKQVAYYPILTNQMCLQCHGQVGTEILDETYAIIQEKYPEDLAIGYQANQVRGIWVVEMEGK